MDIGEHFMIGRRNLFRMAITLEWLKSSFRDSPQRGNLAVLELASINSPVRLINACPMVTA